MDRAVMVAGLVTVALLPFATLLVLVLMMVGLA